MELRTEAINKISILSDSDVLTILALMDKMIQLNQINRKAGIGSADRKRIAFREMLEMRKRSPFPADFDYELARKEAVEAKYGRFD